MGIFGQLLETVGENISKSKEQREQEEAFVRNNEGTKAICAFFSNLFDKGNEGYNWVKKNHVGLYPVINSSSVSLCYMQPGDGKSFSGVKPRDIEVVQFSTVDQLLRDNGKVKTRNIVPYLDNGYQFDDECLRCKLLPVCMGGCIMKRNFMKERTCTPIKFHTDDFVLRKFFKESDTSKGGEIHDADC